MVNDTVSFSGSCLCGEVSYRVTEAMEIFQHCHCSRCQKVTGSAFASNIFVKAEHLEWTTGKDLVGTYALPKAKYFSTAFCKRCGSNLPWLTQPKTLYIVPAGSIDTTLSLRPTGHIHYGSRAGWYVESGLPIYEAMPPRAK